METGVVTIQEPVSTKTDVGGVPAEVILEKSSMEVQKVNLSTVLDDEITSGADRGNNIITGEADVAEVVNGSGDKETEELKRENGEATKTISVLNDSKIVKDDQESIVVREPQSLNEEKEDEKIILSDVTLENKKEEDTTGKPEEVSVEKPVIEEDQTEAKHSLEQEEDIGNISKVCEEIPIKTDEVREETDSRTVETSVNGTEAEHNATVSVEEISRNGDNTVNETVSEDQTATDGEPLHDVETIKREAEPFYKTVVEDAKIVNTEETTAHESKILKEDNHQEEYAESVEATKNSDAAEQSSREVTVDKEKEEDIIQNIEEVQESPSVMESPTIQGEDIESKASLDHEEEMDKITKDTEEQEHVLVRDVPVPQSETLVTEAKTAETFSVQEAEILKTNINESEAHSAIGGEEDGQETKENTEPSKDLKDDKEQEDSETVKTIISSDEVRSSDVQAEVFGEHTEPCSSEIKDDRHGRDESIEVKAKETGPEIETAVDGESVHEIETTERVLLEAEKEEDKEEIKIDEEPSLNAIEKAETENVKIVIEEPEIVNNEETSVHESESLKENAEPVEAVKNSDGTEQISREVTVDRAKEEDIAPKTEEIQERPSESKASLEPKEEVDHISNETEEHEHVLERDVQQCETIESEAVETKEDTQPSLDLKEDKETEEAETFKTVFSSDEVRSSAVQEEQFGEHTEPCSSEIKDESHGKEESVEVKSQETVQDENTEDKHDVLKVPSTESEKYQGNEPETVLVSNTGSYEKSEKSPSDLVLNVDKEELNDEKINVDQVDGTQIMEEPIGLDSNGAEAEQIDQNITNETEEILVAKPVSLLDVKSVEQMQKPKLESPSEVSEETSKTVDEKIEEKPEEEVTLYQEGQVDGSYGLETKEETVSVPESIELEEQPQEERSVIDPTPLQKPTLESPSEVLEESSKTVDEKIEEKTDSIELGEIAQEERSVTDLTPLQEESSQPNEQEKETKLEKHEPTNEEVKSDEVIEVLSASPSKELEGETVVEAENIENIKENEEEQAAEKIQKSLETVQTVESPSSLLFSSEEQDHVTVAEEIVDEKAKEEVPMLQIKNEDDATKIHETRVEQARDIGPSLTEICSINQNQPEEQVKEACSKEEQEKEISTNSENIVNETYALHSVEAAEEETATNGESLDDVETTKSVLLEVRKEEEEAEMKTDAEPRLDAIEKEELETVKTVVQDAKIVNNEETTAHESESLKGDNHQEKNAEPVEATQNLDDAEQISREVTVDTEREADITEKIEKVQEGPTVIETPTIQGEDIESQTSLELKEEVDQSSKDTEEHEHVLERDIPQCETLKSEAVDTSTVEEAAILKTLETNISEPEAMHSETSLDLKVDKEQKEAETVKTVIFSNEVGTSDAQAEEFGEHTEPCSSEIKDESQGSEESVEVKSKETVQGESSEEKDVNMLDVQSGESEKYQENEPDISLVSKTENGDKFEEIPSVVEGAGLDETTHNQTLLDVESVVKQSLDTPSEEETSKTIDEKIEDKPKEEVTLHQEGREEGSYGLDTKDEAVSVLESRELGEQPQQEELCLANEQENETKLQEEQVDKHEPTKEEVSNDQQSPVEEISNEVIQVSSASLSEGPEYETVVEAEKIGEEQVADKIQKSFETGEIVEAHSSLPSSSEEKEHETVSEKTDDEKVKDAEPIGDMRERGLDIAETTHLSLPSVDQKEDVDEIHIPSVALPLDEQEKVTSTEKGETKSSEAEDDKPDEHVDSSTSPMLSEKNDNETQTSKTSEDVCMQQEESGVPKPEESKEDKSQEISETIEEIEATSDQTLPIETSHTDNTLSSELVSEQDDQSPKKVEEIHEEEPKEAHDVEATSERNLPVETSDADNTLSSQLVSETKEEHKLQAGEILPTEIIPRESSDEALVSMLASREDDKVALQEDNCADDVRETNDIQEERSISVETEESVGETKPKEHEDEIRDAHVETPTAPIILEENDSETLIAEAKKGNEEINETERTVALDHEEEFVNHEAPKLEETKDEKSQEIPETAKATETTIDQTLPIGTSQADQTPSLVSDKDDQTPKQVEEILEEETKETHKVQAEDIFSTETVPKESFIEAPVSMLASGEDEPVTPQEGDYAANTQEERHVSAETEEKVGETKPKESQAEGAEKSDDQVEDESTKKTDVEVAGLENDYPTEEAEHGDETYSTLPVVGILTQLQTTLETERAINDSASSEVSMIKEPADQEEKKGDDVVESNEKDFVSDILEAKRLHGDKSGEAEKIKEESGLAGISLPIEEINLQEEHKEEVKVQEETREIAQVLPREEILISSSPLSAEEQEHVISDEKQEEREPQQDFNGSTSEKISLQVEHLKDFETSKKEQKDETHETVKEEDQIVDIKDKKKDDEEQEIVSSEVKKDNKDARELEVGNDFVSRDGEKEEVPHNALENEEEMNEVVASEKQISDPVGVIKKASEAEHEDPVDDIKSNDDRDFPTEQAPKDQSDEVSADETVPKEAIGEELKVPSSKVLDDIQENSNTEAVTNFADRDLPVQNLSELIQSHQSPNQVEETSFEFNKAQEDKKEETVDALITNVQVQDQPKEDFEAPAIEKEISEQEHKLNDLTDVQEDIGTYVKVQVPDDEIKGDGHDSVAAQKEETSLIEEKREVEHVKAEMEDAIKHEVSVEEKNNTSENIDHEAAKEIEQEEGKQTNIVKEEIREEEKEINQESFNNVKETDDAIDKTQPEIRDIESLSSVSKTQDIPEPEYEVPNQQKREITNEVPSLENSKIEEELQKKDEESENTKDLFSVVKETEPTLKEPARKSLSDHIQKEPKTEEDENDDEDHEHKDDKTSPDSIVMVEAKDTVSIVKTHKKSHGILSGVGSKVKHSISKVKKVLTAKSSHTTKPSSPT